jgi:hypothetical protein
MKHLLLLACSDLPEFHIAVPGYCQRFACGRKEHLLRRTGLLFAERLE